MGEGKDAKTSEIYGIMKERIVSMQYMPGQILMVQHISDENGISRTPVREAMVRLRDEGLLEDADGRKFRVTKITWKLVTDIYEARKAIEVLAVSQVTGKITNSQIQTLSRLVNEMEQSYLKQNLYAYFSQDMAFHNKLLEYYNNQVAISWMSRINDQQQRIRYLTAGIHSRMENSLEEHRKILDRIWERDAEGAARMMDRHLSRALRDILDLKKQAPLCVISR